MTDYDSRRTGNGLLDTGSTPVWSTVIKTVEHRSNPHLMISNAVFFSVQSFLLVVK